MLVPDLTQKENFIRYYRNSLKVPYRTYARKSCSRFHFEGAYTVQTKLDADYKFIEELYCIASHEPAFFGKKKQIKELLKDPEQVKYFELDSLRASFNVYLREIL